MNLNLVKRFKPNKKKLVGRKAVYYPTGVTKNDNLEIGEEVIILTNPQGTENKIVDVYKKDDATIIPITVFLKDLSPQHF
jgi:hypothetical protein